MEVTSHYALTTITLAELHTSVKTFPHATSSFYSELDSSRQQYHTHLLPTKYGGT